MTAQRLPIPGQDNGTWGTILNDFLEVSLNNDGTLAPSAITQAGGVTSVNTITPTSGNVTLTAANLGAITQSTADTRYIPQSQLGTASGVATLNGSSQLTSSQLPNSVVTESQLAGYMPLAQPSLGFQTVYASGNGATDTANIQAAINALPTNGGQIFLPSAQYGQLVSNGSNPYNAAINLNLKKVWFVGGGGVGQSSTFAAGATQILAPSGVPAFASVSSGFKAGGPVFMNLEIVGDGTTPGSVGILIESISQWYMENVTCSNFLGTSTSNSTTGTITNGSASISTGSAFFTHMMVGFPISDNLGYIPAGTVIDQVLSSTTAVISNAATGTSSAADTFTATTGSNGFKFNGSGSGAVGQTVYGTMLECHANVDGIGICVNNCGGIRVMGGLADGLNNLLYPILYGSTAVFCGSGGVQTTSFLIQGYSTNYHAGVTGFLDVIDPRFESFDVGFSGNLIGTNVHGGTIGNDTYTPAGTTTVGSGSNGVNVSTFTGSGVLNVAAGNIAAAYKPAGGRLWVYTGSGEPAYAMISYTGMSLGAGPSGQDQFTGCTTVNGTGSLVTGSAVTPYTILVDAPSTRSTFLLGTVTGLSLYMTKYVTTVGLTFQAQGQFLALSGFPAPSGATAQTRLYTRANSGSSSAAVFSAGGSSPTTDIWQTVASDSVTVLSAAGPSGAIRSLSGTSTSRPTPGSSEYGAQYFDKTLGQPIWWNGTSWVQFPTGSGTTDNWLSIKPTAAQYETIPRFLAGGVSDFTTASLTVECAALWLPTGTTISQIAMATSTAATLGTNGDSHWWFGLLDNNLNGLAFTADQTTTTWSVNVLKSLAIASSWNGSAYATATNWTTTYSGVHYCVIMFYPGTGGSPANPTLIGSGIGENVLSSLSPVLVGQSTVLTSGTATPPSGSSQFVGAALTARSAVPYVYVG